MRACRSEVDRNFGGRPRVLVLDSCAARSSGLVQALSGLGLSVHGTGSEAAATSLMRAVAFDAVFIGVDSATTASRLQLLIKNSCSGGSLVTVVADIASPALVDQALAAGAMFVLQCSKNKAHVRSAATIVRTALLARALPALQDYGISVASLVAATTNENAGYLLGRRLNASERKAKV